MRLFLKQVTPTPKAAPIQVARTGIVKRAGVFGARGCVGYWFAIARGVLLLPVLCVCLCPPESSEGTE